MKPLSILLLACAPLWAADLTIALRIKPALDAPDTLETIGKNQLSFTRVSALISSVALLRADGSSTQLDGQYGALDLAAGRDHFTLTGVAPGSYQGIRFNIGVPPTANHSDPASWPAGHPLNPLFNRMHWDWKGGYIFLALEGRYRRADESLGGWSFHLANDENLTSTTITQPLEVPDASSTLLIDFDLPSLLSPLTLSPENDTTHSRPGDAVAAHLFRSLPGALRFVSLTPTPQEPRKNPTPSPETPSSNKTTPLPFPTPAGFSTPALPHDNPLTVEGVALGKALFHDTRLSRNATISCASCHQSSHGFSDPRKLSPGVDGKPGTRHSMPLFNLAWNPDFAWDGSKPRIRDQARAALTNPLEMDADPQTIATTLSRTPETTALFTAAFGTPDVTPARIFLALEQFLLTLVSNNSRFDRAGRGELQLTELEKEGFALFATEFDPTRGQRGADCFHCHGGMTFSDYQPKNNGLDLNPADAGRALVTGKDADAGKFKTPSLRNVALTAPYMHDGRFATLEEVIAHYDHGVARSANLDPNLAKHPASGLSLTDADKKALLAFLQALTDVPP
jgi:cytochrome c peroxidase